MTALEIEITREMITSGLFSFAAAVALGIRYNIRRANLFAAALGAFVCKFLYVFLSDCGFSELFICFAASAAVTVYAEILAKRLKVPVPMFLIVSIVPLVPGSNLYYAMMSCINGDLPDFGKRAVTTFSIAGAIALGIFSVTFVIKCLKSIKKASRNNRKCTKTT